MSTPSMKPQISAALTVTINASKPTFEPASGEMPNGGIVKFRSGDHSRYEVQLWNKTNDDAHPLRLFVPEHDGAEMVADPTNLPRDVKFNIMSYPAGRSVASGGTYTIKITSTDGK